MKYAQIHILEAEHSVTTLCATLEVSRSGYYRWLRSSTGTRAQENAVLLEEIEKIHADRKKKVYGSPRVTEELRAAGFECNHKRVARIMQENGIEAERPKKHKVMTDSSHGYPIAENLL